MLTYFANPTRFLRLADVIEPWAWRVAALALAVGLVGALLIAPGDYQQGQSVRIMYVHVPAAWLALGIYLGMAVASAIGIIWRHAIADLIAKASAPIGAGFTAINLITGSLWGKPMWGTWWAWDARLTAMLILLFLYLGYMALWEAIEDESKAARAAAILALIGAINVPVIRFSVDWWNTLHQPASVITMSGPKIHASMLWPLLTMAVGFGALYVALLLTRVRAELLRRKLRLRRLAEAAE